MADEEDRKAVDQRLSEQREALIRANQSESFDEVIERLTPLIADDYTLTDPSGEVVTKRRLLQGWRQGHGIFENSARTNIDTRIHGSNAVTTSLIQIKGELDGRDVSGEYYETHTLQKQGDSWVLMASQITRVEKLSPLFLKAVDCD